MKGTRFWGNIQETSFPSLKKKPGSPALLLVPFPFTANRLCTCKTLAYKNMKMVLRHRFYLNFRWRKVEKWRTLYFVDPLIFFMDRGLIRNEWILIKKTLKIITNWLSNFLVKFCRYSHRWFVEHLLWREEWCVKGLARAANLLDHHHRRRHDSFLHPVVVAFPLQRYYCFHVVGHLVGECDIRNKDHKPAP